VFLSLSHKFKDQSRSFPQKLQRRYAYY